MAGEPSSTHDVFLLDLSKSGTTKGKSGDLLIALRQSRIRTFIIEDEEELLAPRGDEITPALVTAIQASKIAIVVLPGGYRDVSLGRWIVLAYILDYFQWNPELIITLYYMDRSAARASLFTFYDVFFEEQKKVMAQVDNLPGWDYNGYNYDTIDKFNRIIASQVFKKLNLAHLYVADYPVGLESRLEEVWRLTRSAYSHEKFIKIGFYGMQGIGKSTLARAAYNSVAHLFEVSCFLHNIRENSNTHGLVGVQKMLLSQISGETDIQLENVSEGVSMIKDRLRQKDVLLILDDVDSLDQLEALGRDPDCWFSSGSRVIITTQNKDLLTYHADDMLLYEVQALNDRDALELLSHKGFDDGNVDPRYTEVLNRAIRYAFGHPLVLDMIGSSWKRKRVDECKNALDRLESIRCDGIQGAFTYDDIQHIRVALTYNDNQSIQGASTSIQGALTYNDIQSIQGALMTSRSDPEASHISLGIPKETLQNDSESSQTESNVGVTSQMDFQKRMLILVFVATNIAGLLCDFWSPHFKSSIRGWSLFKFFPFVVFFFAVVAVIQYIYWRPTISGLIKCCICHGIFLFISVYSYFYDRAANGKPGTLSLVSNAMFALASLSLSKLFEPGFETGIFNYFLQCFIIQLLTIHWWLIFVAITIIIVVPLFDWHFFAELFLITRTAKWFGINPFWNQNQNDKKAA